LRAPPPPELERGLVTIERQLSCGLLSVADDGNFIEPEVDDRDLVTFRVQYESRQPVLDGTRRDL